VKAESRHFSIRQKGLILIGLPLLYQAIFIGVLVRRQHDHNDAQSRTVDAQELIEKVDRLHRLMLEEQSGMRGYVITADPAFLPADAAETITREAGELAAVKTASPEQRGRAEQIREAVAGRLRWSAAAVQLVREGRRDEAVQAVASGEGVKLMEIARAQLDRFREGEEALARKRLDQLRRSSRLQTELLIGGLLLNIVVAIGATIYFSGRVSRRLGIVTENARRLSQGQELAAPIGGKDEIGQLDAAFHRMAAELASARAEQQAAESALRERNLELTRANRELDLKSDENEMFVYSVSHDLRSPLVNLQGFSKELDAVRKDLRVLLEGDFTPEKRAQAQQYVDREIEEAVHFIRAAVARLSTIIDALLRLSRAGRVVYSPEVLDLQPVITRILEAMRGSITARAAETVLHPLPPVYADATAVEQIFANLIGNAVNYLDPKRPGRIEIGAVPAEPNASSGLQTLFVKDNGLGIPQPYIPKVFAVFQRLHGSIAPGEGIGLTLVRRMVERHGGRIWVESEDGVGSTFFVSLPANAPADKTIAAEPKV
jgi:signal transduction histidine kinase